jgi:type II secretory pathway pseudopilin PulG
MTLLEMTVVILVLLAMVTLLFIGGQAWKRGADRALCLVNLEMMQKAVRSYSNLYEHNPGENVPGLKDQLIGSGRFFDQEPMCPSAGAYQFPMADQIPPLGTPYITCTWASFGHEVDGRSDW